MTLNFKKYLILSPELYMFWKENDTIIKLFFCFYLLYFINGN
jgi:hypothetical protein